MNSSPDMGESLMPAIEVNQLDSQGDHFAGRTIAIATQHGKEQVIGPILERAHQLHFRVPTGLDTDTLGTFTGEVPRTLSPIEAARNKCIMAMEHTGLDIAIASEGSFGPHPTLYFVPADEEILLLMDRRHGLEILVREISTETNFSGKAIQSEAALKEFANAVGFPSHALILSPGNQAKRGFLKGISEWNDLIAKFRDMLAAHGSVFVQTDMRAMHNPTRMKVIQSAAEKLAAKMAKHCPACNTPGYDVIDAVTGLPCGLCGSPTRSTLTYVHGCQRCNHRHEELFPHGRSSEDPRYCDYCNP